MRKQTTTKTTKNMKNSKTTTKMNRSSSKTANSKKQLAKTTTSRKSASSITCNKQWLNSKKVRPKTVVIVAERTQEGYRIKSATVRVAVNQHAKTAVPITDLSMFVNDIKQKGIRN
jgi:hypothetical protein